MKQIFIILVSLCAYVGLRAQTKETIYTLQKNERIAVYESTLGVYQSRLGFVFVIENTTQNTRKYCVNKVLYENFSRNSIEQPKLTNEHWGIVDTKKDSSFVIFDGYRVAKYPLSKRTFDLRITKRLYGYALYDEPTASYNVAVNGFVYGPYANLLNYYLSPDGTNWAVSYYENVGTHYNYYIKFNNAKLLGPYTRIHDFSLLNSNQWVLSAETLEKSDKLYVAHHKGDIGYFDKTLAQKEYDYKIIYTQQNYAMNVVKEQKNYFMVNGELFGPYDNFVSQTDLGIKPERFNYVVGKESTLYFKDKPFLKNIRLFAVSDSRNTVASVSFDDKLLINGKKDMGAYKNIVKIDFPPNKEDFYFWTKESEGNYSVYACIGEKIGKLGTYSIYLPSAQALPNVHFAPSGKNWGFSYINEAQISKIVVDSKEYDTNFINEVSIYAQEGKECATWLSVESEKIVLNTLVFE